MGFVADLHIHSKYSRATSKKSDPLTIAVSACLKGIDVIGTGDVLHGEWLKELQENLIQSDAGLLKLNNDNKVLLNRVLPLSVHRDIDFILQTEIATIYSCSGKIRKVHHVVILPDFASVKKLRMRLSAIGNLDADGRPIFGIDARDLVEIVMECSEKSLVIPAHIWTPWFSVLGSESGFDSIEECYRDMTCYIYSVETGLSSDPAMNWRVSFIDKFRLVSSSDAHSPDKIGRESTIFDTERTYDAIRSALATGLGYTGTIEFFPEEGKYHLDGHRKCGIRFSPEETEKNNGICPKCGKPVTVGVMHRVHMLADRPPNYTPSGVTCVKYLIPLKEILAEILDKDTSSVKVESLYNKFISHFGPEIKILTEVDVEKIAGFSSVIAEAIRRLRRLEVIREAGYDGEYGIIRIFRSDEIKGDLLSGNIFTVEKEKMDFSSTTRAIHLQLQTKAAKDKNKDFIYNGIKQLDEEQLKIVMFSEGPVLIEAGPGSGKTSTLVARLCRLIKEGVDPYNCLAITFSRQAADEMSERIGNILGDDIKNRCKIDTFHSFALWLIKEYGRYIGIEKSQIITDTELAMELAERLLLDFQKACDIVKRVRLNRRIGKETLKNFNSVISDIHKTGRIRFDELIDKAIELLSLENIRKECRNRFKWVFVDEFQDIDPRQYTMLRLLTEQNGNVCVVGDPRQAIYGFRGADVGCFKKFMEDYLNVRVFKLSMNYRCAPSIDIASRLVIKFSPENMLTTITENPVVYYEARDERAEAEYVVNTIEKLMAGHSFFSIDVGRNGNGYSTSYSFSSFAVLYRTISVSRPLIEIFKRSGIPVRVYSESRNTENELIIRIARSLYKLGDKIISMDEVEDILNNISTNFSTEEIENIKFYLERKIISKKFSAADIAEEIMITTGIDMIDRRVEAVSLMTLHASKGLEFDVVFICGCEEGIIPLRWAKTDIEEERRLFYVGMTRARKRLFITGARTRLWNGVKRKMFRSNFLESIDSILFCEKEKLLKRKKTPEQLKFF